MKSCGFKYCIIISILLLFNFNCASLKLPKQVLNEDSLKETAILYWKARLEDKYDIAYKLEDPENLKKLNLYDKRNFDAYIDNIKAIKNIGIVSYKFDKVVIADEKGFVYIDFFYNLPEVKQPIKHILTDQWIFKSGQWFHILEPNLK